MDCFFELTLNLLLILFSIVVFLRSRISIWLFYKIAISLFISSSSLPIKKNFFNILQQIEDLGDIFLVLLTSVRDLGLVLAV